MAMGKVHGRYRLLLGSFICNSLRNMHAAMTSTACVTVKLTPQLANQGSLFSNNADNYFSFQLK